jgi:AraC-like DNA-binding protein
MQSIADTDGGAILHPRGAPFAVDRFAPSEHVARFVDHYWLVRWQLERGEEHNQFVLSHPVVNVSVTAEVHRAVGPSTSVIERRLVGSGWTFGVMFRPAGFWPLLRASLASIANKEFDLAEILPDAARAIAAASSIAARECETAGVDAAIGALLPSVRQSSEASTHLAERARSDREIVRAEQLAKVAGVSLRTLERRFSVHVGLSPKKVIQRYRLQEVTQRTLHGEVDWASVAADLGYADQAHLIRDFRAATGEAPGGYARFENRPSTLGERWRQSGGNRVGESLTSRDHHDQ